MHLHVKQTAPSSSAVQHIGQVRYQSSFVTGPSTGEHPLDKDVSSSVLSTEVTSVPSG